MSKVFSSMAVSLDGYITSKDGDISWINDAVAQGEDYGFEEMMKRTGAYIMGANTYKEMMKMGNKDTNLTYVVTHKKDIKRGPRTHLFSGDLIRLVAEVKSQTDKDIYLFGGGDLLTQFIDLDLLDELDLGIIPVILGDGVPLFRKTKQAKKLSLVSSKQFKSGMILLRYTMNKSQ